MSLDPIKTTQAVHDSYLRYLTTTFRIRDPELHRQFEDALGVPDRFVRELILETTPPFETGCTLESLIREGLLSPRFRALCSDKLPLDRPLYVHQEQAIRKVVQNGRNLVIATGTGSGKTEAFLVPILDLLFKQEDQGKLRPGVRALLLYPMNALANDQMTRLRELLANVPNITFGRYTGETEEKWREAREQYEKTYQRQPYANELISRDQMREAPPHILLTNYAMLEYLLLRPDDHVFFDGETARDWRFLVIDEAHTYAGAKGIEMGMLLRRLKDRVVDGQSGRLCCIATSATLAGGEEEYPDVQRFAEDLFGERVEWQRSEPTCQDIVGATRKRLAELADARYSLTPSVYGKWRACLEEMPPSRHLIGTLARVGAEAGLPDDVLQIAKARAAGEGDEWLFLYEALKGDAMVAGVRSRLQEGPAYLSELALSTFGDTLEAREWLVALVDLAARTKPATDDVPLIPARYHLFSRAIEGAFIALRPQRRLYLERMEHTTVDGCEFAVFELGACRQCGAAYLVGERGASAGGAFLKQPGQKYYEDASNLEFYLLLEGEGGSVPDDEDEVASFNEISTEVQGDTYRLCTRCGALDKDAALSPLCSCDPPAIERLIYVPTKEGVVHFCPACGTRSPAGLVRRFLAGHDATASVLATALYQQIPPRRVALAMDAPRSSDDAWSSTRAESPISKGQGEQPWQARQLLIFSDSRQDAAFFASYLNRTYGQILRRRLILETIEEQCQSVLENRWRVQDLVNPLQRTATRYDLLKDMSPQEQKAEAWKWILYEFLAIDRRNGLEGLGCVGFSLLKPPNWTVPRGAREWGLDDEEAWTLFQVLLDGFRLKGALAFPELVAPQDEFFYPRNREYFFRQSGPNSRKGILGWTPRSGVMNSRLDYLIRLTRRLPGLDDQEGECSLILNKLWDVGLALSSPGSCWRDYFESVRLPDEGVVYRMKLSPWELRAGTIDSTFAWYHCDVCNSLSLLNLRGVCPTYRCKGTLHQRKPAEVLRDNHYRRLYLSVLPINLVAEEHTAQLTSESAAELQTQFMRGEVNVLSCSTTFELGVDVGELEAVLMRNVPPSAANYVQRAGRAGRRTDSAAFALTFAQRRSHDLAHFQNPLKMVAGKIAAPHFELANEKIVRRHLHATALAAFWKQYPKSFGTVASFFFPTDRDWMQLLNEYLAQRPERLHTSLRRIVPQPLLIGIGIDDWSWVRGLLDSDEGILARTARSTTDDIGNLEEARAELVRQGRPSDYILRVVSTIKDTNLISHLSRHNVIPKYGFPVDVVGLRILHHGDLARALELDRDLRIALSEYAPSGQVVAGGKLWTSRYIGTPPRKRDGTRGTWRAYDYAICSVCQRYQRVLSDTKQRLSQCVGCGSPLQGRSSGKFIVPEFGFATALDLPGQPGEARPERTYASRTYYSGESRLENQLELEFGDETLLGVAASDGLLAVINNGRGAGFKVCSICGFAALGSESPRTPHVTPWRSDCRGALTRVHLGHEFKTDVLELRFAGGYRYPWSFWLSLLYGLLEGASEALAIERSDIDGCLYAHNYPAVPTLVLYDDVPGGAGHVRRIVESPTSMRSVLAATRDRLQRCECGGVEGATSCYGCLRNYRNQYCHDQLRRGPVVRFLEGLGVGR